MKVKIEKSPREREYKKKNTNSNFKIFSDTVIMVLWNFDCAIET